MPAALKKQRRRSQISHLDAMGNIQFTKALEVVRKTNLEMRFPQFMARQLIPVKNDVDPGVQTIQWRSYGPVGMAKIISNYADDLPRADVLGEDNYSKVFSIGNSYGYNIDEVAASAYSGIALSTKRAAAARRANEERVEALAAVGDSRFSILGLLNQPNATVLALPAGASTFTTWATKTADEILADLNLIKRTPINLTNGVEKIDTIVMPENQRGIIQTKRVSTVSDTTVEEFFLRTNPGIQLISWQRLTGAGASATDRIVGYYRNPDYIELNIPKEWTELPPQERNLEVVIPCHSRFGGVILYYPLSMVYADGS